MAKAAFTTLMILVFVLLIQNFFYTLVKDWLEK